jgi:hypothetical protein
MARSKILISGVAGIVLGLALLFLVFYLNSNYIFSNAREHWLNGVRYVGLFSMWIGLALIIIYVLKTFKHFFSSKP